MTTATQTPAIQENATDVTLAELDNLELDATADADIEDLDSIEEIEEIEELAAAPEDEVVDAAADGDDEGDILNEDDLNDLELAVDKAELYSKQESKGDVQTTSATDVTGAKKTGTPRASTPRVVRDLNSIDAGHFLLTGDASKADQKDLDANKAAIIAAKPGQKKIAEKFENYFLSLAAGKAPSKYIVQAFKTLDTMKTMTSSDLVAAFKASGLGEGTARSQTGQIMVLFDAIGVAKRAGKALTLDAESNAATYLRKHI